ncbi:uncharacterized protein YvpB [Tumebacillus permanentifrigoris]|uniref:Uncharacterized protein YvpB n=1 Tax=Tumebacillus permanentifrigoris TaxID=378543 RepID=A0A316DCG7_9BACL|nr:uncharacterized protein YvpB [Tumebacillus permanentifrigoris]
MGALSWPMVELASASSLHQTQAAYEIQGVPTLAQRPELPTGCEATALTMLLQYEGVQVNKTTVAKKLPQLAVPRNLGGRMIGGDPNSGFVGNPFSRDGYGVFHIPIRHVLEEYLPGRGLDLSGGSFDEVLQALADDRPVLAWVTIDLADVRSGSDWRTPSGGHVQWRIPEHCVLLTGYRERSVTFHDPNSGRVVHYPLERFRQIWQAMGRQAVTVQPLD